MPISFPRLKAPIAFPPTASDSISQGVWGNAQRSRKVALRNLVSSVCDEPCGTRVILLLAGRSPSAIARFIPPIHIDPINRRAFGPLPHIFQKELKFGPSLTNGDPPTAILSKLGMPWIAAPLAKSRPRCVSAGQSTAPRVAMQFRIRLCGTGVGAKFTPSIGDALRRGFKNTCANWARFFDAGVFSCHA